MGMMATLYMGGFRAAIHRFLGRAGAVWGVISSDLGKMLADIGKSLSPSS
jgi:hypothetical protein